MTMMMTSSQFGLEDMEALLWGPSSPMADVMDSLFINPDKDRREEGGRTSLEGDASPVSPIASPSLSSSSPPPFYSPPPSPPAVLLHENKAGAETDLLPLPWLSEPGQLRCSQMSSDDSKADALSDLDWMAERMDLSEFDLDSLIGSCSPAEESPGSPEEFLASLDCPMELDSFQLPSLPTPVLSGPSPTSAPSVASIVLPSICSNTPVITVNESKSHIGGQEVPSSPLCVPDLQEELEIKSEPASPEPSPPVVDAPCSPDFTLDLGSEVDVTESEVDVSETEVEVSESEVKHVLASIVPQVPRIVLSLSPARIVLVLAPKNQVGITAPSEVINPSPPAPPQSSPRSRPYPEPERTANPPAPSVVAVKAVRAAGGGEKATLKAPKDKKRKKMEQNKTAATRYRQKKRSEQEALLDEHAQLERKNVELSEKAESMAREIEYLKELMEEVRQTRMKKGLKADH